VSHEDDRLPGAVQFVEQREDLLRRVAVEVAGRLVGEHDCRRADQRPRDRHALALAAGELVRAVVLPVRQPDAGERLGRQPRTFLRGHATVDQRLCDVALRAQLGQQVEALEHEADLAVAHVGQLVVRQRRDVAAVELVAARGRPVQAP
jgi:hypothetical protein